MARRRSATQLGVSEVILPLGMLEDGVVKTKATASHASISCSIRESKNHHGPAEERTGQAYNKERDNEGYLAHVRSYPVLAPPRWIFFADLVQIASFVIVIELAQR